MRLGNLIVCGVLALTLLFSGSVLAVKPQKGTPVVERWYAQTVYVPVYSSVFFGNQKRKGPRVFNVAATVTLRNTDLKHAIVITEAQYVGASGKPLRQHLDGPRVLAPLESTELAIDEADVEGGVGACFIVRWQAEHAVTAPIMQSVMIGTQSSQGISFVAEGHMLEGLRE